MQEAKSKSIAHELPYRKLDLPNIEKATFKRDEWALEGEPEGLLGQIAANAASNMVYQLTWHVKGLTTLKNQVEVFTGRSGIEGRFNEVLRAAHTLGLELHYQTAVMKTELVRRDVTFEEM